MCPTNSDEMICGVQLAKIFKDAQNTPENKVVFCAQTKGYVVWALAAGRVTEDMVRSVSSAPFAFAASTDQRQGARAQAQAQADDGVETMLHELRHLCNLAHKGLEPLMPTWMAMVIRIARSLRKCCVHLNFSDGFFPAEEESLAEWKTAPERAYLWFRKTDHERRAAKVATRGGDGDGDGSALSMSLIDTIDMEGDWDIGSDNEARVERALQKVKGVLAEKGIHVEDTCELLLHPETLDALWRIDVTVWQWLGKSRQRAARRRAEEALEAAKEGYEHVKKDASLRARMREQRRKIMAAGQQVHTG